MNIKRPSLDLVVSMSFLHYSSNWLILLMLTSVFLTQTQTSKAVPSDRYFGIKNQISDDSPSIPRSEARVRLGLRMILFKPGQKPRDLRGPMIETIISQTLRAKALSPNHFYIDQIHILSEPKKWNKKNHSYQMKLSFFESFGENKQVEEKVGEMMLSGVLRGKKGVFILHGFAKKSFKDKFGNLKLQVLAGYRPSDHKIKGKMAKI